MNRSKQLLGAFLLSVGWASPSAFAQDNGNPAPGISRPNTALVAKLEAEIRASRQHLDYVETRRAKDGQLYDWVRPESQPGYAEAIRDMPPPMWELMGVSKEEYLADQGYSVERTQSEQLKGPPGTVPLWRPDPAHMATIADSYEGFLKAVPKPIATCQIVGGGTQACRFYAGKKSAAPAGKKWFGTGATFNIWKPALDPDELQPMTLMQWAITATGSDGLRDTLEQGWTVNPAVFGDNNSHLFTFLTTDNYATSCWNGSNADGCAGSWTQIGTVTPGITLTPSVYGGSWSEASLGVLASGGKWYVWWVDRWIGSVPATYYGGAWVGLGGGGSSLTWYGETVEELDEDGSSGNATRTDMAGGAFVSAGMGRVGHFRKIVTSTDGATTQPFYANPTVNTLTDANCYNMSSGTGSSFWGDWVWIGGPGNNANCTAEPN